MWEEVRILLSDFEVVKESVDITDVAARYGGIQVLRGNKAHCPWHTDQTPSLSFYDGKRRFHCFSCGEGGDAVDLTQKLLHLSSPVEALERLNSDYHLGLNLDLPASDERVKQAIQERERRRQDQALYQLWVNSSNRILTEYFRLLRDWRRQFAPTKPDEPVDPRFIESLHQMDYLDYLLNDIYINGTPEEKKQFIHTNAKWIRAVEQRLLRGEMAYACGNRAGLVPALGFRPVAVPSGARFSYAA